MNLCKCLNCGIILIDENPQRDAKEYPDNSVEVKKAVNMVQIRIHHDNPYNPDEVTIFWACPNCETDDYLSDNL